MPRYFFHTDLGGERLTDATGSEMPNADAAWEAARATAESALKAAQDRARLLAACLVVTDEAGEIVFELPFSEVLLPQTPAPPRGSVH